MPLGQFRASYGGGRKHLANLSIAALEALRDLLIKPGGLNDQAYAIAVRDMVRIPEVKPEQVLIRHTDIALASAATIVQFPAVYLYCVRIENSMDSKFREFSGRVVLVAEVRVSGRSVRGLDLYASRLAEAVMNVLAANRGKWTGACAFDGRFDITFDPVEEGGINFIQTARVEIELIAAA